MANWWAFAKLPFLYSEFGIRFILSNKFRFTSNRIRFDLWILFVIWLYFLWGLCCEINISIVRFSQWFDFAVHCTASSLKIIQSWWSFAWLSPFLLFYFFFWWEKMRGEFLCLPPSWMEARELLSRPVYLHMCMWNT